MGLKRDRIDAFWDTLCMISVPLQSHNDQISDILLFAINLKETVSVISLVGSGHKSISSKFHDFKKNPQFFIFLLILVLHISISTKKVLAALLFKEIDVTLLLYVKPYNIQVSDGSIAQYGI